MKKRIFSFFLAIVMIVSLLPMTVFAYDAEDLGEITAQYRMDEIEFRFSNLMDCMVMEGSLYCGEQRMDCMVNGMMGQLMVRLMMGSLTTGDYELRIPEMECELQSGGSFTLTDFVLPFSFDADTKAVEIGGGTPKLKYDSYKDGVITFTVPKCKSVSVDGDITISYAGEAATATTVTADNALYSVKDNTLSFRVKNADGTGIAGISDHPGSYTVKFAKLTCVTEKDETVAVENSESKYYISVDGSFRTDCYVPFLGAGTDTDPWLIGTLSELEYLAAQVSAGNSVFAAMSYKLIADISNFTTPIGISGHPFSGHFDGADHTVSINMNGPSYQGLFGNFTGGLISNLTVTGTLTLTGSGGIVGGVCGNNNGTIINCTNYVQLNESGNSSVFGGVCGYNIGTLINCTNNAQVTGGGFANKFGGVCGQSNGVYGESAIINCVNNAPVTGGGSARQFGGVCGYSSSGAKIINCVNNAQVTGGESANTFGGVCGANGDNCTINCFYDSDIATGTYGTGLSTTLMKAQSGTDGALIDLLNGYIKEHSADAADWLPWVIGKDGYPVLKYPHNFTYSAQENVLTAECKNCGYLANSKVSLTLSENGTLSEEEITAWTDAGLAVPEIVYAENTASITAGGATASVSLPAEALEAHSVKVLLGTGKVGEGDAANYLTDIEPGTVVTLTAGSYQDKTFEKWIGNVNLSDTKASTVTFTMPNEDVTVEAKFLNCYTLAVFDGETLTSEPQTETYQVTKTAATKDGKVFTGWTAEGLNISGKETNQTLTFNMPSSRVVLTANYADLHTVSVEGGTATGTYTSGKAYAGQTITVTANVQETERFTGWTSEDVALTDATAQTTTFIMPDKDVTVTATAEQSYTVTVVGGSVTSGLSSGNRAFPGQVITVAANSDTNDSRFVSWSGTDGVTFDNDKNSTTTFVMPEQAVTVTAATEQSHSVTVVGGSVTSGLNGANKAFPGTTITVATNIQTSERFTGWTGGDVVFADAAEQTTTFTMPDKDVTVTANKASLHTVTTSVTGAGTITPTVTEVTAGSTVTISTNRTNPYSYLTEIIINGSPTHINNWTGATFSVDVDGDQTVEAVYGGATGWLLKNGKYQYLENGVFATGWKSDIADHEGETRYFDENGIMATGWHDDIPNADGHTVTVAVKEGGQFVLKEIPGTVYFFDVRDGRMATGWFTMPDSGKRFYFFENGIMATGFQTDIPGYEGKTVFFSLEDGHMLTGEWLKNYHGADYYFDQDGVVVTGKQTIGGEQYVFSETGIKLYEDGGWVNEAGGWRLYNTDGEMCKGWILTGMSSLYYYFDENGFAVTGWHEVPQLLRDEDSLQFLRERLLEANDYIPAPSDPNTLTSCYFRETYFGDYRPGVLAMKWVEDYPREGCVNYFQYGKPLTGTFRDGDVVYEYVERFETTRVAMVYIDTKEEWDATEKLREAGIDFAVNVITGVLNAASGGVMGDFIGKFYEAFTGEMRKTVEQVELENGIQAMVYTCPADELIVIDYFYLHSWRPDGWQPAAEAAKSVNMSFAPAKNVMSAMPLKSTAVNLGTALDITFTPVETPEIDPETVEPLAERGPDTSGDIILSDIPAEITITDPVEKAAEEGTEENTLEHFPGISLEEPKPLAEVWGYSVDYAAETISSSIGYELSSNSDFTTTLADGDSITPGATYYYRKAAVIFEEEEVSPAGEAASFTLSARPATPTAPTLASKTDTTVTLTAVNGCEYSKDGTTWQDSNEFTNLTEGTQYTFYQRIKVTDSSFKSANSTAFTVYTAYATPASAAEAGTVSYSDETFKPNSGYEISKSNDPFSAEALTDEKLTLEPGTTYYIRKAANGDIPASATVTLTIPARPAAPAESAFTKTAETIQNKKDGSFSGITADMEYSTDDGATWTSGSATLTGFSNETVKVRYKATTSAFKSNEYSYTFEASTEELTVNINGTEKQVAYGETLNKPSPNPEKSGYTFGGWYKDEELTQAWNFGTDTVTGNMTLYPKWIRDSVQKAAISGNVTESGSGSVSDATVELYLGTVKVAAAVTNSDGSYSFDNAENGIYNIVVTTADGKTKTELVTVNTANTFTKDVELPNKAVSSVVGVENTQINKAKFNVSRTVVGGLDEVAKNTTVSGEDKVTIKLTVVPKNESEVSSAEEIKAQAGNGKKVEFLDMGLWEQVNSDQPTTIGGGNTQLLTIVIPFDFTNVKIDSVMIIRKHESDNAEKLTKDPEPGQEGFTVDKQAGIITIYSMKFSD